MAYVKDGYKRKDVKLSADVANKLDYWANEQNMTISEFVTNAIELQIKFINEDFDIPTAEQQRINQLVDVVSQLSSNMDILSRTITSVSDTIVKATNGSSYLNDETDDGNIIN